MVEKKFKSFLWSLCLCIASAEHDRNNVEIIRDLSFRLLQEELTPCYAKMSGATVFHVFHNWIYACLVYSSHQNVWWTRRDIIYIGMSLTSSLLKFWWDFSKIRDFIKGKSAEESWTICWRPSRSLNYRMVWAKIVMSSPSQKKKKKTMLSLPNKCRALKLLYPWT